MVCVAAARFCSACGLIAAACAEATETPGTLCFRAPAALRWTAAIAGPIAFRAFGAGALEPAFPPGPAAGAFAAPGAALAFGGSIAGRPGGALLVAGGVAVAVDELGGGAFEPGAAAFEGVGATPSFSGMGTTPDFGTCGGTNGDRLCATTKDLGVAVPVIAGTADDVPAMNA